MIHRHYMRVKKGDKIERWMYNPQTEGWKKAKSPTYSSKYLDSFTKTIFSLMFALFVAYLVVVNFPFAGLIISVRKGEILLSIIWLFYMLFIVLINKNVLSKFSYFLFACIVSSTMLLFSDLIMEKYNTIIYNYFLYGSIICILYMSLSRYIKFLSNRKPKKPKPLKPKLDIRSF